MSDFTPVRLPQSGPNDITATIAEWPKPRGSWVAKGEIIAVAETTKSIFEIEAPASGYLVELLAAGAEAEVGQMIALLAAEETTPESAQLWLATQQALPVTPATVTARNWTMKAELLAQRNGIDIAAVPATGERVTEADVRAFLAAGAARLPTSAQPAMLHDLVNDRFPANRIQRLLIAGGGNGAVQIIDALAQTPRQQAVAILDDNTAIHGKKVAGVPVLGAIDAQRAAGLFAAGEFDAAAISISTNIALRARIFEEWKAHGIPFANVIHPSAVAGINVSWGEGNVVMALCHIGPCATVGDNNFLSAYCSIEHHCVLGSHCSFGPGVLTSSRVRIGDRVRCGTGIFIEPGIVIGADSVIASGLAIVQNVPEKSLLKAKLGYTMRSRNLL